MVALSPSERINTAVRVGMGVLFVSAILFVVWAPVNKAACTPVQMRVVDQTTGTCLSENNCVLTESCRVWVMEYCPGGEDISECSDAEKCKAYMCTECSLDSSLGDLKVGDVFTKDGLCTPATCETDLTGSPRQDEDTCRASSTPKTFGQQSITKGAAGASALLGVAIGFAALGVACLGYAGVLKREEDMFMASRRRESKVAGDEAPPLYDNAIYGEMPPQHASGYQSDLRKSMVIATVGYTVSAVLLFLMMQACTPVVGAASVEDAGTLQFFMFLGLICALNAGPTAYAWMIATPREAFFRENPQCYDQHVERAKEARAAGRAYPAGEEKSQPYAAPPLLLPMIALSSLSMLVFGILMSAGQGSCPGGNVSGTMCVVAAAWLMSAGYTWMDGWLQRFTRRVLAFIVYSFLLVFVIMLLIACGGCGSGSAANDGGRNSRCGGCCDDQQAARSYYKRTPPCWGARGLGASAGSAERRPLTATRNRSRRTTARPAWCPHNSGQWLLTLQLPTSPRNNT